MRAHLPNLFGHVALLDLIGGDNGPAAVGVVDHFFLLVQEFPASAKRRPNERSLSKVGAVCTSLPSHLSSACTSVTGTPVVCRSGLHGVRCAPIPPFLFFFPLFFFLPPRGPAALPASFSSSLPTRPPASASSSPPSSCCRRRFSASRQKQERYLCASLLTVVSVVVSVLILGPVM